MEYLIQPEDKQDLLDITALLKSENVPEWKALIILGYVRGRADEIMMHGQLQQTGS